LWGKSIFQGILWQGIFFKETFSSFFLTFWKRKTLVFWFLLQFVQGCPTKGGNWDKIMEIVKILANFLIKIS
jgi:hypothetical protein